MRSITEAYIHDFHIGMWEHIKEGFTKMTIGLRYVEPGENKVESGPEFRNIQQKGWIVYLIATKPEDTKGKDGRIIPVFFPMWNESEARRVEFELKKAVDMGVMVKDPAEVWKKEEDMGQAEKPVVRKSKKTGRIAKMAGKAPLRPIKGTRRRRR